MSRGECPFESKDCKYFYTDNGCFSDVHHMQFPRADYKTRVEKDFRELPENKFQVCRQMHDEIHAFDETPMKPSLEVMKHAINESRINRVLSENQYGIHASS